MNTGDRLAGVEKACSYQFKDKALLERAITHPSAVEGHALADSYERLEFLGDSLLGAIVAAEVFRRFPSLDEGELTRLKIALVSGNMLSRVAEETGLAQYIIIGESERGTGARGMHSMLEDVYEALVGAIHLDGGPEAAHDFVLSTLGSQIEAGLSVVPANPKSVFQEVAQRILHATPSYKLVSEEGPAHDPVFTSVALVGARRLGRGTGPSKKLSEASAAHNALENLGFDDNGDRLADYQEMPADEVVADDVPLGAPACGVSS